MTGERTPWWYSGDENAPGAAGPSDTGASDTGPTDTGPTDTGQEAPGASMDWSALVAGAARMVDWATTTVMAPHAEHADPAVHPQCVVCRTILLVGDPVGLVPTQGDDPGAGDGRGEEPAPPAIRWIPIVDASDDPTT